MQDNFVGDWGDFGKYAWSALGFVWVGWLVIRTIVMIPVWLLESR